MHRLSYKHLKRHKVKPYILGGPQQPQCTHCHSDKTWGHFCHYRSHGPVCPPESQRELQQILIERHAPASCGVVAVALCGAVEIGTQLRPGIKWFGWSTSTHRSPSWAMHWLFVSVLAHE